MQFFLPKFFGATPPGTPPNWGPKKLIFERLKLECYLFLISVDIKDKYFDIVWGCHPPREPPKNQFLNGLT